MKKIFKSKLLIQVVVASMVATLATAGMVGAATTIGSDITSGGTATIYGATSIGGALTATSTLGVTGVTTLTGNLILSTASSTGLVKVDSLQLGTVAITPTGTELNFVDGVTSALQTQLDAKAALASPTFTGTAIFATASSTGLVKVDSLQLGTVAITPTGTELNFVDGVTSAIQDQLGTKSPLADPTFTGTVVLPTVTLGGVASSTSAGVTSVKLNGLTVYGDANVTGTLTANSLTFAGGNLAFATASSTGLVKVDSLQLGTTAITASGAELNYVGGVTSALQTQLDAKAALASPTFTGTVVLPTVTLGGVASSTSAGITSVKLNGLTVYGDANVTGTLTANSLTFTGGNLAFATASSTGLVKVDSLQLGTTAITASGAELNYVGGVTSALQTQLDAKAALASPTFTGTVVLPTVTLGGVASSTSAGITSVKLNGLTVYGDANVTGTLTANSLTFTGGNLAFATASSTGLVKVDSLQLGTTAITASGAELNYVGGVTSALQTQLDAKAALASPTFTGTVVLPTVTLGGVASSTSAGITSVKLNGLTVYGDLTVTGTFTPALTTAATFAVGGGYGSAGLSIDADGNLQTNGNATIDGNIAFATASSTGLVKVDSLQLGTVAITPTGTELNFVDGVTSALQTQLDAKAALASPTFTGTLNVAGMATTTSSGIIMPTQTYTTDTGCAADTAGGLMFNKSKKILCVCDGTNWQAATTTVSTLCF